jgi:hypothetical protein
MKRTAVGRVVNPEVSLAGVEMRRVAAVVLFAVAAAGGSAMVHAASAGVNPLTGQPLAFEAVQRRLEQMRLETQMLEEEAKQTNIRNSMTLAPIRRSSEERRLQAEMFGPLPSNSGGNGGGVAAGTVRPVAPVPPRRVERPAVPQAVMPVAPSASLAAPVASGPQVMAILRNGERRQAIVQVAGTTATVVEGDQIAGRKVGPITERSVNIDGVAVDMVRGPAVVAAIDRRPPPGQPAVVGGGSASQMRPAGMQMGVPGAAGLPGTFPPLPPLPTLPAIGPLDPDNPLSLLAPQAGSVTGTTVVPQAAVQGAPSRASSPLPMSAPSGSGAAGGIVR